jgi:hypothetical protein
MLTPGLVDIARRLGVVNGTAKVWHHRGLLSQHRWTVSNRPAWEWRDIKHWAKETGRLPTKK